MRFEETDKTIKLPEYPKSFIYFLTRCDEVVYVGQTATGISRPLKHNGNKNFDGIYIMPCEVCNLDYIEGLFIDKYRPEYNAMPNIKTHMSVKAARNDIKEVYGLKNSYSMKKFYADMKMAGVEPIDYSGTSYISFDDFYKISMLYESETDDVEE